MPAGVGLGGGVGDRPAVVEQRHGLVRVFGDDGDEFAGLGHRIGDLPCQQERFPFEVLGNRRFAWSLKPRGMVFSAEIARMYGASPGSVP